MRTMSSQWSRRGGSILSEMMMWDEEEELEEARKDLANEWMLECKEEEGAARKAKRLGRARTNE